MKALELVESGVVDQIRLSMNTIISTEMVEKVEKKYINVQSSIPELDDTFKSPDLEEKTKHTEFPFIRIDPDPDEILKQSKTVQSIIEQMDIKPLQTIRMPKLQVSKFPDATRFHMNPLDNSYRIMYRPWMKEFIDIVLRDLSSKDFGNVKSLTGPQGVHYLFIKFIYYNY